MLWKIEISGSFSNDLIKKLEGYSFPGNIRELENILERCIILTSQKKLTENDLTELNQNNFAANTQQISVIAEQDKNRDKGVV